jgi:hypothetical protein
MHKGLRHLVLLVAACSSAHAFVAPGYQRFGHGFRFICLNDEVTTKCFFFHKYTGPHDQIQPGFLSGPDS